MTRSLIAAGALALAVLASPGAGLAAGPTGSRVLNLCRIEDPSCRDLLREAYDRVQDRSKCPDDQQLPFAIALQAWAQMGPQMIAVGPGQDIDWSMGSAISTIDPSFCVAR